jgi:DNA-binding NtrC family response regulator
MRGLFWRLTCPAKELIGGERPKAAVDAVSRFWPSRARRGILIVEDELLVALEGAHLLMEAGFDVLGPAPDVAGAFAFLNPRSCDAAVLDMNLGHETSEAVAIELAKRKMPFLTLSGYSRPQQGSSFDGAPALAKPLKPELLIATIAQCLAAQRSR